MRLIRITLFSLLAAHVALLLLAPTPAPRTYRVVQLTLSVATVACLAALVVAERRDAGRAE